MKKIILCLVALCCCLFEMRASHMAGADLEFKLQGSDTLKLWLRVYRDCNGIPINPSPQIMISTIGCLPARTTSVTLTKTLVQPVRFTCGNLKSICEGGTFPFGLEEYRFEATVYLQQAFAGGLDNACCSLKVVYQECCRSNSMTNADPTNFFLESRLNRCLKPNNSGPRFLNAPMTVICNGQPFKYNNGVADTMDHDSTSIELADPLFASDSAAKWKAGYGTNKPLDFLGFPNNNLPYPSGFHLNPATGDLAFTPSAVQQPVLAFLVKEYALINGTWQLISTTRRDAYFFVYQCPPNNPPEVSVNGSKTGPFYYTACAGSAFCLNLGAMDVDSLPPPSHTDSTQILLMSSTVSGDTFTHVNNKKPWVQREDAGIFCWTPTMGQVSSLPYYFTVKAVDNNCPVPASATVAIAIKVVDCTPPVGIVKPVALPNTLHIYPNPARDGFTIAAPQDVYNISLYDMEGREVLTEKQSGSKLHVKRNNLPAGVYTIRMTGSNGNLFSAKVTLQ